MVASYTQLLARRYRGQLGPDADEFIAYAVDGATRMRALIDDLLAYSRIGTRGQPFQPVDLNTVVARVLADLAGAIEDRDARIVVGPLPTVSADPSQLHQLFQNLIGNAIKFAGDATPRVEINAERREADWVVSIKDNGIGIEEQYLERIFVLFQRLHTRADYPGTGIGLAICKKIVERHGGRIWVESKVGQGSTFFLTLPVRAEAGGA